MPGQTLLRAGDMEGEPGFRQPLLHDLLDWAAMRFPERPAVRDEHGCWTYTELAAQSRRYGQWLSRSQRVGRGDRVALRLNPSREFVALLFGALRIGAVAVPLNVATMPFHLSSILADSEPSVIIVDDEEVAQCGSFDVPVVGVGQAATEAAELIGEADQVDPVISADLALLIYTSGSTSFPKAVVCPHRQAAFAVRAIAARLGYRHDDVVFCRLPLSFDYGLYQVFLTTLAGAELVLAQAAPNVAVLNRLRDCGATVVPVVPSLADILISLVRRDSRPTRVRLFTNTGAALVKPTLQALRLAFPDAALCLMYGTTECKRITIMDPDEDLRRPGTVGRPLPGTEVYIVDEHGERLPLGSQGEIVVRGEHVMQGYWRAPELSDRIFRRSQRTGETMLHTGDYGHLDEHGYLVFTGRRDDIFKRHGTRASISEIEAAALDIPGVERAVAYPPTDDEELLLLVVSRLSGAEILRSLALRLEQAKIPPRCYHVSNVPLTMNGKPDRAALRRMARELTS